MDRMSRAGYSTTSFDPNNIKKQLLDLENYITQVNNEISFHKKEVQIMRSETDTLEEVLTLKANDVKKSMINEIERVEEGEFALII